MTQDSSSKSAVVTASVIFAVLSAFPWSASSLETASAEPVAAVVSPCDDPVEHPVCLARGDLAPRFKLRDLDLKWHYLSNYVGDDANACGRPLIIEFFAMNCDVCKQMTPILVDFAKRNEGRVQVVVIAVTEPADSHNRKLREYFRAAGAGFPVLIDLKGSEAGGWVEVRNNEAVLPHMFLIDSGGHVIGMAGGWYKSIEAAFPELRSVVRQ